MTEILPQEIFESRKIQLGLEEFAKALARATYSTDDANPLARMDEIEDVRNALGYLMHQSFVAGTKHKGKLGKDYQ